MVHSLGVCEGVCSEAQPEHGKGRPRVPLHELCMTHGQEGHVHGWQSRIGKKNQVVLDTLFIKLKDPPTEVQFEGLPKNVVPIYPTTNNIQASLPNDDRILVSHTQIEILVNFAMTDFASQGKTRPNNVCDLNNLQTHQSYYTSLSRSASAEGTLILHSTSDVQGLVNPQGSRVGVIEGKG